MRMVFFFLFAVDEQYELLKRVILFSGKGRRPSLPSCGCSMKLVLQLVHLYNDTDKTWTDVTRLFSKIFPGEGSKFLAIRRKCIKEASTWQIDSESDIQTRLLRIVDHFEKAGDILASIGVAKNDLVQCSLQVEDVTLTNGMLFELERFRVKAGLPWSYIFRWISCFGLEPVSEIKMKKRIKNIVSELEASLKKTVVGKRSDKCEKLSAESFLWDKPSPATSSSTGSTVDEPTPEPALLTACQSGQCLISQEKLHGAERDIASLKARIEVLQEDRRSKAEERARIGVELCGVKGRLQEDEQDIASYKVKLDVLVDECRTKAETIRELNADLQQKQQDIKQVLDDGRNLRQEISEQCATISEKDSELSSLRQANFYKRLQRKEAELSVNESVIEQHRSGGCDRLIDGYKKQIKNLQTQVCNGKVALDKFKADRDDVQRKMGEMEVDFQRALNDEVEKSQNVVTKDGQRYTSDVVKAVIELVGEAEVPAVRCGRVIHIVSKNIFHNEIPLTELPSERTTLRYADQGHVLSKIHVASKLEGCGAYDLHSDGTTKDHRKYVGHQVTLDSGESMSLGFTMVSTEDTQTLLSIACNLFQELADIYENDADDHYKTMLANMVGLMSDRASVMKSFDRQFDDQRKRVLNTEESLQFLHCNAHFLLGLSSETEKVVKGITKGNAFGRDQVKAFGHFSNSSETCVSRYLRLACSSLGPRGDEKSGCRDTWEAFCELKGESSQITSFRSNRFNNFFQGAVGLHYHRSAIQVFFNEYHTNNNLKLRSVLADAESDEIDMFIVALGILYHKITGPYWQLVRSDVKYLDFHVYVGKLAESLEVWSHDASSMMQPESTMFDKFNLPTNPFLESLYTSTPAPISPDMNVQMILQKLAAGFLVVVNRQLNDFLPGGKYHNVDENSPLRARMKHCKLHNLLGEACFGDLDFSLFKRRNASLHHQSTINMLKRNQTMSGWFSEQSETEQKSLLNRSATLGPVLRQKHHSDVRQVREKLKVKLQENKAKVETSKRELQQRKEAIAGEVRQHGGPCLSLTDVDRLMIDVAGGKSQFLKHEISYQKLVLGYKSKFLKTTGNVATLTQNLKNFFHCKDDPGKSQIVFYSPFL